MDFREKVEKLEKIEEKAQKYAAKLHDPFNSKKLMYDMRDEWEEVEQDLKDHYPEQWREYCEFHGLNPNYTFGDILA